MSWIDRRAVISFAMIVLVGATGGCAPVSTPQPKDGPVAQAAAPAIGTSWTVRETDNKQSQQTITLSAVPVSYEGKDYYGINNGSVVSVRDPVTFNTIATLRDDKVETRTTPGSGTYSWPLWVGKAWSSIYSFEDRTRGRSWNHVQTDWRVTAYEDVTVPAGTFKAFKLVSSPGVTGGTFQTVWYAPDARAVVKAISIRLPSNYLGQGETTTELLTLPK